MHPKLVRVLEPEVMDGDHEATIYDSMDHSQVNEQFVHDLALGGKVSGELLDIGTGTARIPIEIISQFRGCRIVAIDLSPSMLDVAKINLEVTDSTQSIRLDLVDAKSLPYDEAQFDLVISNSIIHHIAEPASVFAEAIRVTKPGGRLFFRDLLRPATERRLHQLVERHVAGESSEARQLFEQSLQAALNIDEVRAIVAGLGHPANSVRVTSDRHWTWDSVKS